ncbi:MAG: DUF4468 domain-containing protein [Desulfobacterales bacterium]
MSRGVIIAFCFISVMALTIPANTEEPVSLVVVEYIQMSKNEIFDNTILWLAEGFKGSKAGIDFKDREIGTIAVNTSADLKMYFGVKLPVKFKIRIDIKENKYRLKYFDVIIVNDDGSEKPIEMAKRESLEPKVIEKFNEISASFEKYLLNARKNKDW